MRTLRKSDITATAGRSVKVREHHQSETNALAWSSHYAWTIQTDGFRRLQTTTELEMYRPSRPRSEENFYQRKHKTEGDGVAASHRERPKERSTDHTDQVRSSYYKLDVCYYKRSYYYETFHMQSTYAKTPYVKLQGGAKK